jgi:hypothetical protein
MIRAALALFALLVIAGFVFVRGCSGPRPEVASAAMRARGAEAVVRNAGSGEGEIQIEFRAHPRAGGAPLVKTEKVTLRPHETARIQTTLEGARGDERLEVEAEYPPK